ncbi:signal peptidase II [Polymorphospora sp. NPDC050346]|uniref:signal peptidase II n=1 Tax=Polymorphospora sp. NPDC050346 TaxID=3155780 RepID=UPI0033D6B456
MTDEQSKTDDAAPAAVDTTTTTPRAQRWTRHAPWIAALIAVTVITTDQLSKMWAEGSLTRGERTPLVGDALGIQLTYNPGAAFSIGSGATWIFTVLTAAGVVAAAWYAWRVRSRVWAICLGLVLGGATTHLLDRLLREPSFGQGHVVDFIAYFDWFIGNVADIAIFFGAVMFFALTVFNIAMHPEPADEPEPSTHGA